MNLTKKTSGYTDGELPPIALQVFNYLQSALVAEPLVPHPRPGYPYHLSTDTTAGDETILVGLMQCLLSYGLMD